MSEAPLPSKTARANRVRGSHSFGCQDSLSTSSFNIAPSLACLSPLRASPPPTPTPPPPLLLRSTWSVVPCHQGGVKRRGLLAPRGREEGRKERDPGFIGTR